MYLVSMMRSFIVIFAQLYMSFTGMVMIQFMFFFIVVNCDVRWNLLPYCHRFFWEDGPQQYRFMRIKEGKLDLRTDVWSTFAFIFL